MSKHVEGPDFDRMAESRQILHEARRDRAMTLEQRQKAGVATENEMLAFMLQFEPCQKLKVEDVKEIARFARSISFKHFEGDGT